MTHCVHNPAVTFVATGTVKMELTISSYNCVPCTRIQVDTAERPEVVIKRSVPPDTIKIDGTHYRSAAIVKAIPTHPIVNDIEMPPLPVQGAWTTNNVGGAVIKDS